MGDKQIRNVIFDFGGVVVGYDPASYVKKLFGDGPAARYALDTIFSPDVVGSLDLGQTTREAAYAPVMARARADGFEKELTYVRDHWIEDMMGTKEDTVALVRRLRESGYGVYYLTNMPSDLWEIFCARGLRDIFLGGVASFEVHVTKPDRRIYEILLERTGIDPGESVFLDDMERNIRGGEVLGLRGILFTDAAEAERELAGMGVCLCD